MENKNSKTISALEETSDRELFITRILNAPRELVFKVWSNPTHIAKWWGPDGFTTTIHQMDVRKGGEWNLTMHGPDGTDYKNKSVFTEILKPERIAYDHISGPKFHAVITFEAQGEKTKLTMKMIFESAESKNKTVKEFGAEEGLKQNINRLETYLQNYN
jgi:uncharacterized protein YndB with AHSA1/START domain